MRYLRYQPGRRSWGAERRRVEWSVSEGLQSEAEKILPIITVFLSPLIRRSESSVLLGLVGQGCNQGEVRHGVLLTGLPADSHKDRLAHSL